MTYISFSFLIFFAVLMAIYFVFPSKYQYIILFAASYIFYFFANGGLPIYIAITTLIVFAGTNLISKIDEKTKKHIKENSELTREEIKAKSKKRKN